MAILITVGVACYVGTQYWQRLRIYKQLRARRITVQELNLRIAIGEKPVIVDLRDEAERAEGVIPTSIPFEGFKHRSPAEFAETEVVLYCSCPDEFTSARAALRLQRLGVRVVRPLQGGFPLWLGSGLPVETPQDPQMATGFDVPVETVTSI
jgi:rhodanese-related sulfurtransferase